VLIEVLIGEASLVPPQLIGLGVSHPRHVAGSLLPQWVGHHVPGHDPHAILHHHAASQTHHAEARTPTLTHLVADKQTLYELLGLSDKASPADIQQRLRRPAPGAGRAARQRGKAQPHRDPDGHPRSAARPAPARRL
jgi:hypothetical protein